MSGKKGVLGMLSGLLGSKEKASGACCGDQTVNLKPVENKKPAENASCCGGPQNAVRLDDQFEIAEAGKSDGAKR